MEGNKMLETHARGVVKAAIVDKQGNIIISKRSLYEIVFLN
jgi:hypothetical protein